MDRSEKEFKIEDLAAGETCRCEDDREYGPFEDEFGDASVAGQYRFYVKDIMDEYRSVLTSIAEAAEAGELDSPGDIARAIVVAGEDAYTRLDEDICGREDATVEELFETDAETELTGFVDRTRMKYWNPENKRWGTYDTSADGDFMLSDLAQSVSDISAMSFELQRDLSSGLERWLEDHPNLSAEEYT